LIVAPRGHTRGDCPGELTDRFRSQRRARSPRPAPEGAPVWGGGDPVGGGVDVGLAPRVCAGVGRVEAVPIEHVAQP